MRPGDIILLWYMPYPLADRLIYRVTDSHLDHVSIVLPSEEGDPIAWVYEAQPPRVRKMPVDQYLVQIKLWAHKRKRWRDRRGNELKVELLRPDPPLKDYLLRRQRCEAERWLGKRYSMVWNYLLKTKGIHCSELVARCLSASGIFGSAGHEFRGCDFSRVSPIQIRERMAKEPGWWIIKYPGKSLQ